MAFQISTKKISQYTPHKANITKQPNISHKDANEYYSTTFHESVHSTMKESRCNRAEDRKGKLVAYGSDEYSKEELIAEIGSASLMNIIGIETTKSFKNSSAYIQGWLSKLQSDVKFIVSASSKAEKAVKYILGET